MPVHDKEPRGLALRVPVPYTQVHQRLRRMLENLLTVITVEALWHLLEAAVADSVHLGTLLSQTERKPFPKGDRATVHTDTIGIFRKQ